MQIAVIDHFGNAGGGTRFIRSLLPAIKKLRPSAKLTFFGNASALRNDRFGDELRASGIQIQTLKSCAMANFNPFGISKVGHNIALLQQKYAKHLRHLPKFLSGAVYAEVQQATKGFDIAFFPWPYYINCPKDMPCPMVATFHDFNFHYYFSGGSCNAAGLEVLNREIPVWLKHSSPVVSTHFMKEELGKFYPLYKEKAQVIHLAPFTRPVETEAVVSEPFILYPTHLASHKNIGALLSAHYLLKQMGHPILLILTGPGTELVRGRSVQFGVERDEKNVDVKGLGYVSHTQMDALIKGAQVVVTTSLYEAGNGPGLDAWAQGTPVAMSNIPAFMEHLEVQGVRAAVFDPLSPVDIANKLQELLINRHTALENARLSQEAIAHFTWESVANKYLEIFDENCSH